MGRMCTCYAKVRGMMEDKLRGTSSWEGRWITLANAKLMGRIRINFSIAKLMERMGANLANFNFKKNH